MSKISIVFLSACLVLSISISLSSARSFRTPRLTIPKEFQNINVDGYLSNKRNVQFQLKCLLYNGPCDRIGKYLKESIPDYIQTRCSECEPAQKKQAQQVSEFLEKNYPKEWNDALEKFQL